MPKAILDTKGANCPSCRRAIEHSGRRIEGVNSVEVDIVKSEIHVDFDGREGVVDAFIEIVDKLGYVAIPRKDTDA